MIPVLLEIEGLYSYKEKQTIDFTQLTSAGLFGIFGAVGSGKSSILEAILLALYGNTERLSARGEKSSMVNLQSDRVSINFEFLAGKNNQTRFRSQYLANRNRNNWEDIRPASHSFYRFGESNWEPLEERAEDILGMKMDHFRQTVIIPQGKFRDFIELGPKDRATMMRDLFGLERFELSHQTRSLLFEVKEQKLKLNTQLEGLAEFTKDQLKEQTNQLKELKEKEVEATNSCNEKEQKFTKNQRVREQFQEFKDLQIKWDELQTQRPQVDRSRTDLQQYQKASLHFKPIFTQLDELGKDLEKYKVSVTDCKRWKDDFETEVANLIHTEGTLQKEFAKKGEREAKIRDLKKVIDINALQLESQKNKELIEKLTPNLKTCRDKIEQLANTIKDQEKQLEALKTPNPNELADLKNCLREIGEAESNLEQIEKEIKQQGLQLKSIQIEIKVLQNQMPVGIQTLADWLKFEENNLAQLQANREKLIRQQGLSAYAQHLHDGEPCPLCGAEEHPQPLTVEFDSSELEANESQSKEVRLKLEEIRRKSSSIESFIYKEKDLADKIKERESYFKQLENKKNGLMQHLKEKGFNDPDEVKKALDEASAAIKKQQTLFQQLKVLRQECRQLDEASKSDEERLQKAQNEYTGQLSAISSKKDDLQFKDFCSEYFTQTNDQIKNVIDKVQKAIDELEVKIQRNKDALIDARGRQSTNLANLKQFTELLKGCEERQGALKETLLKKMNEMGFDVEEDLKAILNQQLNVDQLEARIREFERQWEITKDKLDTIRQNEAVVHFSEEAFQQLKMEVEEAKTVLEQVKSKIALTHNHIETTKQKLEEKTKLNKSLEAVEKRESNLRELDGLFKGSGFVKYVSSIYLKDLSHSANLRFMKLTKNNLSLEIDSDNTFWVRDHLNGGKKRLLKTLSGGQTFQASLCLALALAEKVKSLNRADQSFFFLDEGFGSLDRNSLRVVFETLKSLRHENRIVGIISHVEELQQEIGVYAEVELDAEKGSVVRYSY